MNFKTISKRIFALVIPTLIVTTVSFSLFSYYLSNSRINDMVDDKMRETLNSANLEIQLELYKNTAIAFNLAKYSENLKPESFDSGKHKEYLRDIIESNDNTFGAGIWFEPYKFNADSYHFCSYLFIDDNEVFFTHYYDDYEGYFNEDWYQRGIKSSGEITWSKVHHDFFPNSTMITAAKPFYADDGSVLGVATADMTLNHIQAIVRKIAFGKTGMAFIIGAKGEYISFFDEYNNDNDTIQANPNEALAQLGKELLENKSGITSFTYSDKKMRLYYTTMEDVNWTLAVTIEENEINISAFNSFIITIIIPILGLAFIILGIVFISRYLRKIINKVNAIAYLAASGDFSKEIEITETDEFGFMEQRLNIMIANMNDMRKESAELLNIAENAKHLLHAVNKATSVLLTSNEDDFESSLRECMEMLAHCIDVDRINIWRKEIVGESHYYNQEFEWLRKEDSEDNIISSESTYTYSDNFTIWEEHLLKGRWLNVTISGMSQIEQDRLKSFNIKSLLVIPVYMNEHFWGFVSYDDFRNERTFSEDEVSILRSANLMMTSAIFRNETAASIRNADERVRIMLDATPLCCCIMDKEANIIDCNEEAVNLYKLKDKQEYIDRFFDLIPKYQPDGQLSKAKIKTLINEAYDNGRVVTELMHQNLDGELMSVEVTFVPVKRGHDALLTGYTRDLREYKKMMIESDYKDSLLSTVNSVASILLHSETEEFIQNLWMCMGMMAGAADADRVYIWKNHEKDGKLYSTQLYEWSENVTPQQGDELTTDVLLDDNASFWKKRLSENKCINDIVRNMSDAEQAHLKSQNVLSILIVPLFLEDRFWGFVGFYDCHCERIFTNDEVAILRSGSLLVAHALLRNKMTLEIHAAIEEAQAASRAKSNFLSNMSHEIRTPLNAITSMTMIGKSAATIDKKNYALDKIENASVHLLGVINDILDMSKIEANKFELSDVEFDFEKMLQKVVNVINFRIDQKKQSFMVYIDRNIPRTLIGDDQRLSQIITNLLSNAVKFTPDNGSIRLDTLLIAELDGICEIQVQVADTGIGIQPEKFSRLFESFMQVDNNTSRQYGGTGLGLAISKRIVELMNGKIWADSEPGKGSKFTFTFKIRRGTEEFYNPLSQNSSWQNINVLIVDDDYDTREYFLSIAKEFGINCDTASNGDEALALIETNGSYDIYFVDWKMPGINGIELSGKIKQRYKNMSVVIMISAIDWAFIEFDAKNAGVDRFLPKPLFPSSISDCINEYLGQSNVHEATDTLEDVSFEGCRILLAEDIDINREIVITLLEPTLLEIDCAVNGIEAVAMFKKSPEKYDMILMDVQMPEMDGLEATRQIRSLGFVKAESIPIVAMTANVFKDDIQKCLESGMNDHIGKPLDFDETLIKMKRYLQTRL